MHLPKDRLYSCEVSCVMHALIHIIGIVSFLTDQVPTLLTLSVHLKIHIVPVHNISVLAWFDCTIVLNLHTEKAGAKRTVFLRNRILKL